MRIERERRSRNHHLLMKKFLALRKTVLLALLALLTFGAADPCIAQELRVTVRDSLAGTPIVRALVTVRREEGGAQVFGLTNQAGQLSLQLPSPGRWAVSIRRIGLEPRRISARAVGFGDVVPIAVGMRQLRFSLPAVRVVAVSGSCPRADGSHDRTSALWEQVTLALQASVTAERNPARTTTLRAVGYDRELDRNLRVVSEAPVQVRRGVGRPFAALHPDSLAMRGYIRSDADLTLQYFAPDEIALLSPAFERTHCFETPSADASTDLAELRFRPAPSQDTPDIAGTAFVDARNGALRRITFRFVNADSLFPAGTLHAGGEVHFDQLPDGEWIVSSWVIRMPRMVRVRWARGPRLTGYHEVGAVVDTLAASAPVGAALPRTTAAPTLAPPISPTARRAAPERTLPTGDQFTVGGRLNFPTSGPPPRARDWRRGVADRRRFGVGVFLDSTALADATPRTAFELLQRLDAIRILVVPEGVPAPSRDEDADLAEGWVAGAALPVMTPIGSAPPAGQCHVKLFLDGERTSAVALGSIAGSSVGGIEFYARPRDVPEGFRRSGNRCGTVLLWSRDGAAVQP
ncbi:MAG: carboxypeptidase-like regulatory domain-containing protein [Gemmatimonadaceae bacterium]|nr:carboxypeptidase-like regulatory domain-containing protein [Gemmatimonadaceae bacterium]